MESESTIIQKSKNESMVNIKLPIIIAYELRIIKKKRKNTLTIN